MEALLDCTTVGGNFLSTVLCNAATISRYPLTSIAAYTALPECLQYVVSYNILSQPQCVAGAVATAANTPYAECVCSNGFADVQSLIGHGFVEECQSESVASAQWTGIAETWCDEAAGGLALGATTTVGSTQPAASSIGFSTSFIVATKTTVLGTVTVVETVTETSLLSTVVTTETVSALPSTTLSTASSTSLVVPPGNSFGGGSGARDGAGLIVGSVFGGAVGLLLLSVGLYWFVKVQRKTKQEDNEKAKDTKGKGKEKADAPVIENPKAQLRNENRTVATANPDVIEFYQPVR